MSKFKTLPGSTPPVVIGGAVLALSLVWPPLSTAQNKVDQAKGSNPHAQYPE